MFYIDECAKKTVKSFLSRHGMYYGDINMKDDLDGFLCEMEMAASGRLSSLKMIPTYIGKYIPPEKEKAVAVIDIGGTNVRSAVVRLSDAETLKIKKGNSFLTPGINKDINTKDFFAAVAGGVKDCITASNNIGICFSLATVPQKDRDAVMIAGGKQIKITDMIGKKVAVSFREAMCGLGINDEKRITVVNDSVAAALGGHTYSSGKLYGGHIGFIYGTGTNLCFREKHGEIINVESGAYCGFKTGDIDELFDATLIDSGSDRFEKMVSGGYQAGLMLMILKISAEEGVISEQTWKNLKEIESLDTCDISRFINDVNGSGRIADCCENNLDRHIIASLIDNMTERSACLCSIAITAVLMRAGIANDLNKPAFIAAEGSTYMMQKGFKEKLNKYMDIFANGNFGLQYEFHVVPNNILAGTAIASLSE